MAVGIAVIAVTDLIVVSTKLDLMAVTLGCAVGVLALVYLLINRLRPMLWRSLPLKEISIGCIFAAGTMVGLLRSLTSTALPAWTCFAALCSLNCISIAIWEKRLDDAQQRTSIATAFPRIKRYLLLSLALLALASLACGFSRVHLCIAISATLLAALHFHRDKIQADVRTALADLVLLTPLIALTVA